MRMWHAGLLLCLLGAASGFEDKTVYEYLTSYPNLYSNLTDFIDKAGLKDDLSQPGAVTIFAPTNAAFAALSADEQAKLGQSTPHLSAILHYHMVKEFVMSDMILQSGEKKTLEGQMMNVTQTGDGGIDVNGGAATVAGDNKDIIVNNGVVQPIDTVLFPPIMAELTISQILLKEDDKFQDLFYALILAGMEKMLEGGDYTVFAPLNSAFLEYQDNLLSASAANAEAIYRAVLNYHIVPGGRRSSMLKDGDSLYTMAGQPLQISAASGLMVNNANIAQADIPAINGYVHAIDKLLLPPNINDVIQAAQG